MFERIVSLLNDIIWSPVLVVLLVGAGLYFSFRTRFVQVRRFGLMVRSLFAPAEKSADGQRHGISSFEAFCVALSGRVGTGNIVGVATAIALGGPGAIFWMWIIAFFGASTAFVESTLAQKYKFHHETGFRGGPASYIEKGLGKRWLGVLFSVLVLVGYGTFLPTVQSNGMSGALANSFQLPPLVSGIGLAVLLGLVIIGGIKSIARVASIVTPFMALGYIVITLVVIAQHLDAVPGVFKAIVTNAFGINPLAGGILGSTIMMGVKRGIFSNEAGQGGGAIVSASAAVSHPAKQGLAQAFSVYVDTLLICTATALMILCSGSYNLRRQVRRAARGQCPAARRQLCRLHAIRRGLRPDGLRRHIREHRARVLRVHDRDGLLLLRRVQHHADLRRTARQAPHGAYLHLDLPHHAAGHGHLRRPARSERHLAAGRRGRGPDGLDQRHRPAAPLSAGRPGPAGIRILPQEKLIEMNLKPYLHEVKYYETDKMGITHHSNYIRIMEEARIDWMDQLGYGFDRMEAEGIVSPVVSAACNYKKTTTFKDVIEVEVKVKSLSEVKLILAYTMRVGAKVVATGETVHCFFDGGRPAVIADRFPTLYEAMKATMD